jgi:hypothetical protein
MGTNDKLDFLTIVGKYVNGKLEYSYPQWMMMFARIDHVPMVPPLSVERYEIHNPSETVLVENAEYSARVIHFDDGDIAEIIDKVEPNGATE